MMHSITRQCCFLLALLPTSTSLYAGAYVFADEMNGVDNVTHPSTYNGYEDIVTIRVCIDPASPNAADMEYAIQNNVAVYNQLAPTLDNLKSNSNNNIPSGHLDFESVALHELGHCLGMGHINLATESGLSGNNQDYTKTTDGSNNAFDINAGNDGIIGSSDDIRGDDINLVWFRKSNNDPFTIDSVIDSTTYSRNLSDLPAGHNFAANASRNVSTLLGHTRSEAVMQQGTYTDEAQRTLGHDDVATLRYAASGVDERESGRQGIKNYANDNYTIVMEYGGIDDTNCDISVGMTTTSSLAFCNVSGAYIASGHVRITTATIEFGQSFNWFFNAPNSAPVLDSIGNLSVTEGDTLVVPVSASDVDTNMLSYSTGGLPGYASFIDHGDGTATLTMTPSPGDASVTTMSVTVSDNGNPVLSDSETFDISVAVLDTDGDGLGDYDEITLYQTLPDNPDSDGDLINDGDEINHGSDPMNPASWPHFADGDIAPLGAPDGVVNAADLLLAQRIALNIISATTLELAHGDLYPVASPDGVINTADLVRLLQLVQQ